MNFNFLYKKNIYVCAIDYNFFKLLKILWFLIAIKWIKPLILLKEKEKTFAKAVIVN